MAVRRCAYCGRRTAVLPLHGLRSTWLSRAPHSPLKAAVAPLCEAERQGRAATRDAKWQVEA